MAQTQVVGTEIRRPDDGEFLPYYGQYIARVPDTSIFDVLETQLDETFRLFDLIPDELLNRRPRTNEWSPLDIAVHLADTERILGFRAFWFARQAGPSLPG